VRRTHVAPQNVGPLYNLHHGLLLRLRLWYNDTIHRESTVTMMTAKILVVDDEVGMREGCRRALMPQGYQVHVAEHGVEGLSLLREGAFDLVLLDAMMPGMGGLELLDRIHKHDPTISCVMITGYATVDLAAQAMKQGASAFLPKPFTSDELLEVVQQGLAERQRALLVKKELEREQEAHEVKRVHQEMAKLDAIESRFMLVLVHELRNPAGVIKNYLQLMRAGYVDEDEWDEYLARLDSRAGQLLAMLDDLLELAHLKKGLLPANLPPVRVDQILSEVVEAQRPMAEEKDLRLELQIETGGSLSAQPAHLRSLWLNLIGNAIQYTEAGAVRVELVAEGEQLNATISDTGTGIPTDELAQIFQEFYRSETAKNLVPLGTGLGLPIVNQIVRLYQGTIDIESVPDQGTTVTIVLPMVTE
jgi:signal transduction histidine kinase